MSAVPGTMAVLNNAVVNAGGEIEKINGFTTNTRRFHADTKGLETTEAGLVTFTHNSTLSSSDVPIGVSLIVVKHPAVLAGESYSAASHALSKIRFSCNFYGKAFCCAEFADGTTALYYDGTIIDDSVSGLVLTGLSDLSDIASQVAAQFNALSGWVATPNKDANGNPENGSVIVKSPVGDYFTLVAEETSTNGVILAPEKLTTDFPGVANTPSVAKFGVTYTATGTINLQAPNNPTEETLISLTGGVLTIPAASSAAVAAQTVVNAVNALTTAHGFRAVLANTDDVFVYAPIEYGALANVGTDASWVLTVTVTGGVDTNAAGTTPTDFTAYLSPSDTEITVIATKAVPVSLTITVGYANASATPTYVWSAIDNPDSISRSSSTARSVTFSKSLTPSRAATGRFRVIVTSTNATPSTITIDFTVILRCEAP